MLRDRPLVLVSSPLESLLVGQWLSHSEQAPSHMMSHEPQPADMFAQCCNILRRVLKKPGDTPITLSVVYRKKSVRLLLSWEMLATVQAMHEEPAAAVCALRAFQAVVSPSITEVQLQQLHALSHDVPALRYAHANGLVVDVYADGQVLGELSEYLVEWGTDRRWAIFLPEPIFTRNLPDAVAVAKECRRRNLTLEVD